MRESNELSIISSDLDAQKSNIWTLTIAQVNNWDIFIQIMNCWPNNRKMARLRCYSFAWGWKMINTHEALSILAQIEENPNIQLQFTKFIEKACIEIEEWILWLYYDENTKTITVEIHNTQENWEIVDKKASIRIALEWTPNTTQELILYTSQKIMDALANLQNIMKKEEKLMKKWKLM